MAESINVLASEGVGALILVEPKGGLYHISTTHSPERSCPGARLVAEFPQHNTTTLGSLCLSHTSLPSQPRQPSTIGHSFSGSPRCSQRAMQGPLAPAASSMTSKAEASASPEGWQGEEPVRRAYFDCFVLKVAPCSLRCQHDWTECPYAHVGEKAARRDPRLYKYTGIACVSMKQDGKCALGTSCPYAHSAFEYWLHPTRYHTEICKQGVNCNRKICFFAHRPEELRKPLVRPGVYPDTLAMSALSALACEAGAAVAPPLLPRRALKVQPARLPSGSGSTALWLRPSQAPSTATAVHAEGSIQLSTGARAGGPGMKVSYGSCAGQVGPQGTPVGSSAAAAEEGLLLSLAVAASQPKGAGSGGSLVEGEHSGLSSTSLPQAGHSHNHGYSPYHDASPTGVLSRLGSGETINPFEGVLGSLPATAGLEGNQLPADTFGEQHVGALRSVKQLGWATGSTGHTHTSMGLAACNADGQQGLYTSQETPVQAVMGLLARNNITVEQAAQLLQAALPPQDLQLLQLQLAMQ